MDEEPILSLSSGPKKLCMESSTKMLLSYDSSDRGLLFPSDTDDVNNIVLKQL